MTHPLRLYRLEAGVTLQQLADRVQVNKSSLSRVERGLMQPSLKTVDALVRATGGAVRFDDFLRDHSERAA